MIEHVRPRIHSVRDGLVQGAVGRALVLGGCEDILDGGEAWGAGGVEGSERDVLLDESCGGGAEGLREEGGIVLCGDGERVREGRRGRGEEGAVAGRWDERLVWHP